MGHMYSWNDPPPGCAACGRRAATQKCGPCGRRICEACYGEWKALACTDCKEKARKRHAAATH